MALSQKRVCGFTILELLVVMVILGLLATLAAPQVMKQLGRAKHDTAKLQIENLGVTLDLYKLDNGDYPTTEQGLLALIERPSDAPDWNGPYSKKSENIIDPWGAKYNYKFPGENSEYDLFTFGADKRKGGAGDSKDITNW